MIIGVELPVDTIHNSRPIQLYTEEGGFQNGLDKLNNRQSLCYISIIQDKGIREKIAKTEIVIEGEKLT